MNVQPQFICPKGFQVGEIHSGVKSSSEPDLLAIISDRPACAQVVYTQNHVKGAHIFSCQKRMKKSRGQVQSLLINSGIANALTGDQGIEDADFLSSCWAKICSLKENYSLMFSTGVVGERLPVKTIEQALPDLYTSLTKLPPQNFGWGMATTDTRLKARTICVQTSRGEVILSGMSKGAGMVHPRLATMLCFVVTDLGLSSESVDVLLREAIEDSFHCISVDSDTSPNDSVILMGNGASGVHIDELNASDFEAIRSASLELFLELAVEVARDGEGISHLIEIDVQAATQEQARDVAECVATSPLVKTAIFGKDPNWGRIICAAGKSTTFFDVNETSLSICGVLVFQLGQIMDYDHDLLSQKMHQPVVQIDLKVSCSGPSVRYWTSDLSYDYVKINADYRT